MLILTTSFISTELHRRPATKGAQFLDDLTRLRADALIVLGWITGSISYLCSIFLIWPVTGAGAVVAVLPIIVAFLFTQQYFIRGIVLTSLKS